MGKQASYKGVRAEETIHRSLSWPREDRGAVTRTNDQGEVITTLRALDPEVRDTLFQAIALLEAFAERIAIRLAVAGRVQQRRLRGDARPTGRSTDLTRLGSGRATVKCPARSALGGS